MTTIEDVRDKYVKEYREAGKDQRVSIRDLTLIQFFTWKLIKETMEKIDEEEAV